MIKVFKNSTVLITSLLFIFVFFVNIPNVFAASITKETTVYVAGTPPVCPAGQTGTPPNCTSICTAPQVWNGTSCVSDPVCQAPRILNGGNCECPAGTTWNGSTCVTDTVVTSLSGSLNPSSTSCTVPAGGNSCSMYFTWSTSGTKTATSDVRIANTSTVLAFGDFGADNFTVPHDGRTFDLFHGNTKLDSDTISASCVSGATWNGSICLATVSGLLQVGDCTIPSGSSTCDASVHFDVSNSISGVAFVQDENSNVVGNQGVQQWFSTPITPGSHNFNLLEWPSGYLASDTGTATCESGSTWNGLICLNPNGGSFGLYFADPLPPTKPCPIKIGDSSCNMHLQWYFTGNNAWLQVHDSVTNAKYTPKYSYAYNGYEKDGIASWSGTTQDAIGANGDTTITFPGGHGTWVRMHQLNWPSPPVMDIKVPWFSYTPSCEPGAVWNGTICVAATASTLSATGCQIALNASTCNATVNWQANNTTGAVAVTRNNPTVTVSSALSGTNVANSITYNTLGYTYFLYNNGNALAQSGPVFATCASGAWNGTICAPVASPTLTATSCSILLGESTCKSLVDWFVPNPGAVLLTRTNPQTTITSGSSGSLENNITFGLSTYYLSNNGTSLFPSGVNANAVCAQGQWQNGKCESPSVILSLTALRNQIVKGVSAKLTLGIQNAKSCTMASVPSDPKFTGAISVLSSELIYVLWPQATTTYSVTCLPLVGTNPTVVNTKVIVTELNESER